VKRSRRFAGVRPIRKILHGNIRGEVTRDCIVPFIVEVLNIFLVLLSIHHITSKFHFPCPSVVEQGIHLLMPQTLTIENLTVRLIRFLEAFLPDHRIPPRFSAAL
jgi:hypothetical protein